MPRALVTLALLLAAENQFLHAERYSFLCHNCTLRMMGLRYLEQGFFSRK
jgi:hypothetical protein